MQTRTKIIIVLAIAALLGLGWFLYTGRSEASFSRITPEQAKKAVAVLSRDQDNDGLKDWEEELWHTDVLVSDTDGDGDSDGEEIQQGRDPLKAGPGDTLDQKTIDTKTVPGGEWSETDKISRELFAKYLTMKQSGEPLTEEQGEQLVGEMISKYPKHEQEKAYTTKDIRLAATDDIESLHTYGNALGSVISAQSAHAGESELVIFEQALENDDEAYLSTLQARINHYEGLLKGILAIPVPESAVELDLQLVNALQALKESVTGMSLAFSDPVLSLSSATAYPAAIESLITAFQDLAAFLTMKNVTFGREEKGYILVK